MSTNFGNFCDDFFVNMHLHTALPMPEARETILGFCEAVQKEFPDLSTFYRRDDGTYVLEGDRTAGSYRCVEIAQRELSSGAFNPDSVDAACRQHAWVLERSRYFLGISHLDVESLDLVYGFELEFTGNRDAIVCNALLEGSQLGWVLSQCKAIGQGNAVPLNCEPVIILALDEECFLQARLALETRNSSYQVRTGCYDEEPISIYFTVRAYPRTGGRFDMGESLRYQAEVGEDLVTRVVIPNVVRPIAAAIAAAQ